MRGIGCFINGIGKRGFRFSLGFLLTVAVFITQYPCTLSLIVSKPMTVVLMVGNRVRIGCSRDWSSLPVDWEFAPADTNTTSFIYTGRQITANLTARYKIDTDNKTRYDLLIDSVDSSHAGTYICTPIEEGGSNTQSGSSQLIVIASDPVCTTNVSASNGGIVEGDYLNLWCTVNYTGNWLPVMDWNKTAAGRHLLETIETTASTSSLTIPLYSGDNGVTIGCKMSFNSGNYKHVRSPRPGEILPTNEPVYQYLWTFKASVLYATRNLVIEPRKSVYAVGEHLECSAKGNPNPTYEWMEMEANRTVKGSVLPILDYMRSEKTYNVSCTAYNTVNGTRRQIDETITFKVTGASSKVTSTGAMAVIALGIAVALSVKA